MSRAGRRRARAGAIGFSLGCVATLAGSGGVRGADGVWINKTGAGTWTDTNNWKNGVVANGVGATADFSTINLPADEAVHLNAPEIVGTILFGDTGPGQNYTIDNNGSNNLLTLAVGSGTPMIEVAASNTATISAGLIGTQGLLVGSNSPGILVLSGANSYTGTTTISSGATLNAVWSAGGVFGSLPQGSIVNNGALTLTRNTNDTQFHGVITGSGTTTIAGNGGYLNLGSPGDGVARLSSGGDLTVNIGLNLSRNAQTVGALTGSGAITSNAGLGGSVSLIIGNNGNSGTFSGVIDNAGSESIQLFKKGAGTQTFTGANTYSGGTVIIAGTLQLGDGSTANGSVAGNIDVLGTLVFNNPLDQTYSGVLSDTGSVVKKGAGALTLSGSNTNNGALSVDGGTLKLTGSESQSGINALGVGASGSAGSSGVLNLTGSGSLAVPSGTATIGAASGSTGTMNLGLAGSTGAQATIKTLNINATGTVTVTTGNTLSVTGGMTVNGGHLTSDGAAISFFSSVTGTIQNGGSWMTTSANAMHPGDTYTVNGAGSMAHFGAASATADSLTIAANDHVNVQSGGALMADGHIHVGTGSGPGGTTASLSVSGSGATVTATGVDCGVNFAATTSLTSGGALTASTFFEVDGNGALIVDGAGSTLTTGNFYCNGGTASLTNGGTLSVQTLLDYDGTAITIDGGIAIFNDVEYIIPGGNINFITGAVNTGNTFEVTAAGINLNGGAPNTTSTITASKTLATGQLLVTSASTIIDAGQTLTIAGGVLNTPSIVNNGALVFTSGGLAITGPAGLSVGAAGPLGASATIGSGAALNVTGPVTIASGGSLTVNGFVSAGSLTNNQTLLMTGSGTLTGGDVVNGHLFEAAGIISGNGGITNNATLLVTGDLVITKSGSISNTASSQIIVSGGVLSLNLGAASTLTNDGTILLNGGLINGSGGTIVNNAAGLISGPGTIARPVINSGTIDAGNSFFNISQPVTNVGTLRAGAGANFLMSGAGTFPTNAGAITLAGGTFSTTGHALSSSGTVTGFGTFSTGGFANTGTVVFTGGPTAVNGSFTNISVVVLNQLTTFTGTVGNSGSMHAVGAVVNFQSTYSGAGSYLSDPSTNIFHVGATISVGGSMTGTSAGDEFQFLGGPFTNNGTFTNPGSLTAGAITNTGSFTQSGVATYGGDFTNAAGTATLGGSQTWGSTTQLNVDGGSVTLASDPGSASAYNLAVKITPATSAVVHIASSGTDQVHLRNLRVNTVGNPGDGLLILDAATNGSSPNPFTQFGSVGSSVAVYLGDGAGNSGLAQRASIENLWRSAALEGYWALQNGQVSAITRGVTLAAGVVTNPTKNGLVILPSIDEAGHTVTYLGEDINGDTNGDAKVDVNDVGVVLQHLSTTPGSLAGESGFTIYTPAEGDVNGDLVTDVNDLTVVLANLNQSYAPASGGPAAPVPEPACILLCTAGAVTLVRRRRRS